MTTLREAITEYRDGERTFGELSRFVTDEWTPPPLRPRRVDLGATGAASPDLRHTPFDLALTWVGENGYTNEPDAFVRVNDAWMREWLTDEEHEKLTRAAWERVARQRRRRSRRRATEVSGGSQICRRAAG